MGHPLRDYESPKALAKARQSFDFEANLREFDRLLKIVAADLGTLDEAEIPDGWQDRPVRGHLSFAFADLRDSVPVVTGETQATLDAVCQRCLRPFEMPLSVSLDYVLTAAQEAGDAPDAELDGYESWELAEDRLKPADLVEEAIVMALPMAAAHATLAECGPLAQHLIDGPSSENQTTRPFAGLKAELDKQK